MCHELEGLEQDLLNVLSRFCAQETGLTFGAKMYLGGQFEGTLTFYEAGKYPFKPIGPVRFLWKTQDSMLSQPRRLWVWSHPAIHKQIEEQIKAAFDLKIAESSSEENSPVVKKRKLTEAPEQCETIESSSLPTYASGDEKNIRFKSLKDKLIRFKLVGPLSTQILANVLQTVEPKFD